MYDCTNNILLSSHEIQSWQELHLEYLLSVERADVEKEEINGVEDHSLRLPGSIIILH